MPKKRILPYIILGLLQDQSLTGKELTDQFKQEIGEFWKASHSQIYPELTRMVADGWLKSLDHNTTDKREKHYQLTKTGKEVLTTWIKEPVDELPLNRDLFSLKLFFINERTDPELTRLLREQKVLLQQQLAHLKVRQKLLFADEQQITAHFGHYLILKRAIARQKGQLAWLDEVLTTLE